MTRIAIRKNYKRKRDCYDRQILTDLLKKKEFKAVRSILEVMNTVDIAALLAELDDKEMILAFRLIDKAKAAEVFAEMSGSMQAYLVEMFTEKELKDLIDELYMDDTVDLLEELPANLVTRILEQVDKDKRAQINTILNYPEDSAGSIMTTEYVDLRRNTTVKEAWSTLRRPGSTRKPFIPAMCWRTGDWWESSPPRI